MQVSGQYVPTFQVIYQLVLAIELVNALKVRQNRPQRSNFALKVRL